MSVFRERVEKHKEEIAELEECEVLPERVYPVSDALMLIQSPSSVTLRSRVMVVARQPFLQESATFICSELLFDTHCDKDH